MCIGYYYLFIKNDGNRRSSTAVIFKLDNSYDTQKSNWLFGSKNFRGVLTCKQLNIRYLKNHNYLVGGFFGIPS
jgi:hypothetical protein